MPGLRDAQDPGRRRTIGRALLAAALLTATAAVPATAAAVPGARTAPAAAMRGTAGTPAYQRVAHFYGAYIDAVSAQDGARLATSLRSSYLTDHLRTELAAWEKRNHADGVLRAQNTPLAFRVTPRDSSTGHTWSTVRLTWSEGKHPTYSYLTVRSDLTTGRLSAIDG